jgi:SAM-dependent methyltransferase
MALKLICQVCGSTKMSPVVDLGLTPLVNTLPNIDSAILVDSVYDLALIQCNICTLIQLRFAPDMKEVFPESYPYLSGLTAPLVQNFENQANSVFAFMMANIDEKDLRVLDIGSNDGSLLSRYKERGCLVYGIEPTQAADVANLNGIKTDKAYFDSQSAQKLIDEFGRVSLVTATNVFAHIPNPLQILDDILLVLKEDGIFVSENHYFPDLVTQLQIDTIYHEHLRYYTVTSIESLLEAKGLEIIRVEPITSHGGSIRVWSARKGAHKKDNSSVEFKDAENQAGISNGAFIPLFQDSVQTWRNELRTLITNLNMDGATIGGIGAPSRAVTLISYLGLNHNDLIGIGERTGSKKIGRRIPTTRIPIIDEQDLLAMQPSHLLLLSWHMGEFLMENLRKGGFKGDFILPLPSPSIVKA